MGSIGSRNEEHPALLARKTYPEQTGDILQANVRPPDHPWLISQQAGLLFLPPVSTWIEAVLTNLRPPMGFVLSGCPD